MSERLEERIYDIITNNMSDWNDDMDAPKAAAEIAAMIEAERKPDTLTVPEAVERLVEFFSSGVVEAYRLYTKWYINIRFSSDEPEPSYYEAIVNGNRTPAAVKVGLEDLFVTILTESEK